MARSNLDRGYCAPRSTQPSIPPGSVYEQDLCKSITDDNGGFGKAPIDGSGPTKRT